jgi:hypothetical protein
MLRIEGLGSSGPGDDARVVNGLLHVSIRGLLSFKFHGFGYMADSKVRNAGKKLLF